MKSGNSLKVADKEMTTLYGPAPDFDYNETNEINENEIFITNQTTNTTNQTATTTTRSQSNNQQKKENDSKNVPLIIGNVLITIALIILGAVAVLDRKFSKTTKVLCVIGVIVLGTLLLYFVNSAH